MQFKVPQDVQQPDRIVWFLTLRQLIICIIGFAFAYAVYTALNKQQLPIVFWFPPVLIIGAITAAFAFLKIANMPFHVFLAVTIERFLTPSKRVWIKGADRVIDEGTYVSPEELREKAKKEQAHADLAAKEEQLGKIGEITNVIDVLKQKKEEVAPLKAIDHTQDEKLLEQAFFPKKIEPIKPETKEEKILQLGAKPINAAQPQMTTDEKGEVRSEAKASSASQIRHDGQGGTNDAALTSIPDRKKRRRKRKNKLAEEAREPTQPQPEAMSSQLMAKPPIPAETAASSVTLPVQADTTPSEKPVDLHPEIAPSHELKIQEDQPNQQMPPAAASEPHYQPAQKEGEIGLDQLQKGTTITF